MSETKSFDVPTLVSVSTGVLLTDSFSKVHEACEWLLGHPVWTHEFASPETWAELREKLLSQHPDLDIDVSEVTRDNVLAFAASLVERLGESREVEQGSGVREKGPVETLSDALDRIAASEREG